MTITGREYMQAKGRSRRLMPELIEPGSILNDLGLSRKSLIDLAMLIGTDFNEGVRVIGPKRALDPVRRYGSIEAMPREILARAPANLDEVRRVFLEPKVTDQYRLIYGTPDYEDLKKFLCRERRFSREKVEGIVKRLMSPSLRDQSSLAGWLTRGWSVPPSRSCPSRVL